jgi:hypothetical protein
VPIIAPVLNSYPHGFLPVVDSQYKKYFLMTYPEVNSKCGFLKAFYLRETENGRLILSGSLFLQ